MSERDMWIAIRAALLAMADAIARRWELDKYAPLRTVKTQASDCIITPEGSVTNG